MISNLAQQFANNSNGLDEFVDEEEQALMDMENVDHLADDTVYLSMNQVQNAMVGSSSGAAHQNLNQLTNDDDVIDYFLENNPDWVVCEYFRKGVCKYGDSCKYMHPKSLEQYSQPSKTTDSNGKVQYEGDEECVICLEKVLANGKRFGILENCSHAFCLECIRDWRATYDKKVKKTHYRTCPICRANSYLVIPSTRMIYDGPLKDQMLDEYTEALANIPCKHFNQGRGYCPFQNSCFYAHYLPNGEWYDYPFKQDFIDGDGVVHDASE